jgi:crossover junction endodeoxyribonuclease RuvC
VRILGIDPGYGILGWSIVDTGQTLIDYGVIETAARQPLDERLLEINRKLTSIISRHAPDSAAIERLFFARNTTTALDVAKTIGAVILTLKLHNIGYYEYTPAQIKQAVTGYGRAGKEQMKFMIQSIFRMSEVPTPDDAADAIAIALCHSLRQDIGTGRS